MEEKEREVARQGLLDLDVVMAGMAACWSREGARFAGKIREELQEKLKNK